MKIILKKNNSFKNRKSAFHQLCLYTLYPSIYNRYLLYIGTYFQRFDSLCDINHRRQCNRLCSNWLETNCQSDEEYEDEDVASMMTIERPIMAIIMENGGHDFNFGCSYYHHNTIPQEPPSTSALLTSIPSKLSIDQLHTKYYVKSSLYPLPKVIKPPIET